MDKLLEVILLDDDKKVKAVISLYLLLMCGLITKCIVEKMGYYYDSSQQINVTTFIRFIMSIPCLIVFFCFIAIGILFSKSGGYFLIRAFFMITSFLIIDLVFLNLFRLISKKKYPAHPRYNYLIIGDIFSFYTKTKKGDLSKGMLFNWIKHIVQNVSEMNLANITAFSVLASTAIPFYVLDLTHINKFFLSFGWIIYISTFYIAFNCLIWEYIDIRKESYLDLLLDIEDGANEPILSNQ